MICYEILRCVNSPVIIIEMELNLSNRRLRKKDLRLLVEITKNNIDFLNPLNYHEIRQLDGIRSNIGIFDKRLYGHHIPQRKCKALPNIL